MPQARKSARSSSRRSAAYKEPAALRQLNRSLEAAQKALTELRKHAGTGAGKSTKSLHGGMQKFITSAKRDSGKLTTALKRDFEQAQKAATSTAARARTTARKTTARATGRKTTARPAARKTTARRATRKTR